VNVVILHDAVTGSSRPDEIDALHQADLVASCMRSLGHRVDVAGVGLDLNELSSRALVRGIDLVFNLVESLAGFGRLIHVVPAVLEANGVAFTGSGSGACLLTTDKPLAKAWLHRCGIPTPPWSCLGRPEVGGFSLPCSIIVKPTCEDASVGIDESAIKRVASGADIDAALSCASLRYGDVFAEQFIEGREFNLSLLCDGVGGSVEVLPAAEIEFVGFPVGKPHIVGYGAKWDETSFEYGATPRRFDFREADQPLLRRLRELAEQCWDLFGLRDYARVDFRVDDSGRPWVLEVNANPCLSADAGFMAAAGRHGLKAEQVIERIVAAGFARCAGKEPVCRA
jgi:D-alanine-D-alanine ligase